MESEKGKLSAGEEGEFNKWTNLFILHVFLFSFMSKASVHHLETMIEPKRKGQTSNLLNSRKLIENRKVRRKAVIKSVHMLACDCHMTYTRSFFRSFSLRACRVICLLMLIEFSISVVYKFSW